MNKKLLLIAGAAITSAGIYSASVMAATTTGTSTANVIETITILSGVDLAFGDIVSGTSGTVILDTANGTSGGLTTSGIRTSGTFDVDGADGKFFTISLPTAPVLLSNGPDTLSVSAFTDSEGGVGQIPVGAAITIGIGASLTADGTESPGAYSNTYSVTVNYQ